MNRKITAIMLCMPLVLTGCGKKEAEVQQSAKIVKTQAVSEQSVSTGYSYIDIVKAKDTKNYSFLTGGKIAKIYVEKGQQFKAGDTLASLDTTTMEYNASIGENTKDQANATLQKTISTYDTNIANAKSQISTLDESIAAAQKGREAGEKGIIALENGLKAEQENIEAGQTALDTLKEELDAAREINAVGGLSDKDLDAAESTYKTKSAELDAAKATYEGNKAELESKKAELDSKRAELDTAKAQKTQAQKSLDNLITSKAKDVEAAQASVKSADTSNDIVKKNINDSTLKADSDGYVMELPYKEGEIIAAGYPVVVAKSKELIVTIGASDSEYKNIKVGGKAVINGDKTGTVTTIAQYPDEKTRTYAVDIAIDGDYTIGETVDVKIITGSAGGCYVPIDAVFSADGVDYVYAVDTEGRVHKKQVVLGDFSGDKVEVQIDDPTALVVTEGVKNLRENDLVKTEA